MKRALCVVLIASAGFAQSKKPAPQRRAPTGAPAMNVLVAEGKYHIVRLGGAEVFDEPWQLYRTKTGYEVRDKWQITHAAADGAQQTSEVAVKITMAPGLHPTALDMAGPQGELRCDFVLAAVNCTIGPNRLSVDVEEPYNYFLPSPWMLGSTVRHAKKDASVSRTLTLVRLGRGENGLELQKIPATVQYVGDDIVDVGSSKMPASIYSLRSDAIPEILVTTDADGLVLSLQDASKPDQKMQLVEYKKAGRF